MFLKIAFIYFLERAREGEREGEKHQCVVASCTPLPGDLAHNPSMCPDWELNRWPCGLKANTQSTEPHQPRPIFMFLKTLNKIIMVFASRLCYYEEFKFLKAILEISIMRRYFSIYKRDHKECILDFHFFYVYGYFWKKSFEFHEKVS